MALFGQRKRLGDQLVDAGVITEEQLSKALEEQKNTKTKHGETIMAMGFVSDADFAKFMHISQGFELATDDDLKEVDPKAIEMVSDEVIKKHEVIPFGFESITEIKVAMSDPMNLAIIDDITMVTGLDVVPYYAPQKMINIYLDKMYGKQETTDAARQFEEEHAAEYAQNDAVEE